MQNRSRVKSATLLLTLSIWGLVATQAEAVVLYATSTRNTSPPSASDGLQGWNLEYQWGSYLATPIAPNYFIAAKHVNVPSSSVTNGVNTFNVDTSFNGVGYADDPASDLRIFRINGVFPQYAQLYSEAVDGSLIGKTLTDIGRGTQRGSDVIVNSSLKGWQWGASDGVESWGQNQVSDYYSYNGLSTKSVFTFDFNSNGLPNEAAISTGDSSGGVFIQSGGAWKLAGINWAVDSPFATTSGGSLIYGDYFDASGLWYYSGGNWTQVPGPGPVPGSSYASNISDRLGWINTVVPEPGSLALLVVAGSMGLGLCGRRYLRRSPRVG